MNKKLLALFATIMMLAVTVSTVSAQAQTVFIPAGFVDQAHYNVTRGQSLPVIGFMYNASRQDLVKQFIDCVDFTVTLTRLEGDIILNQVTNIRPYSFYPEGAVLTGKVVMKLSPEVVRAMWSTPAPTLQGNLFANMRSLSWASWNLPLDDLPPGNYELLTEIAFPHALSAGCDRDGDGIIDIYLPEEYSKTYVATIHVAV